MIRSSHLQLEFTQMIYEEILVVSNDSMQELQSDIKGLQFGPNEDSSSTTARSIVVVKIDKGLISFCLGIKTLLRDQHIP